MPFYGHQIPSVDYFNSNLTLNNFIIAGVSTGNNLVFLYDERTQGIFNLFGSQIFVRCPGEIDLIAVINQVNQRRITDKELDL
jgi:hypothetical protein